MRILLIFLLTVFSWIQCTSCTVAVISGKYTPDGRPLLYKHRDNDEEQVKILAFMKGKYPFLGLVDARDEEQNVWIGFNSAGFALMNSASYNLNNEEDPAKDREGWLIREALSKCADVNEYEAFLKNLKKPYGVEANFGVMDAKGNVAFYETGNEKFVKIDANDPLNAPLGFAMHTNFSFSGRYNEGSGYIRYMNAELAFFHLAYSKNLTPRGILQKVSRNLFHSVTRKDLYDEMPPDDQKDHLVAFEDYTPRFFTSASIVIQGVKPGENPQLTTMWTVLGWPLASVAIPVWLTSQGDLPAVLTAKGKEFAPVCMKAVALKEKCFVSQANSKSRYLNLTRLINGNGTGILQSVVPLENSLFEQGSLLLDSLRKEKVDEEKIRAFYKRTDQHIGKAFIESSCNTPPFIYFRF